MNNGNACLNKISKLEAIYVKDKYRNNGIATSLIEEFKLWSSNHGIKYIEVQVLNDNVKALNLYTQEGFNKFKSTLITTIEEKNKICYKKSKERLFVLYFFYFYSISNRSKYFK